MSAESLRDLNSALVDFYQDVYRPLGYTDHCFVHIPAGPDRIVFTGLTRDGRPFDRAEMQLLELLQPHLANGLELARAVTAASDTPTSPELFAGAGLTPRESDVLFWLTQGKANEDIAKILSLRADSVSRYLRTIYEKIGVEHRVAAVIRALDLARRLHAETLPSLGGDRLLRVGTR